MSPPDSRETFSQFAARGISGLTGHQAVARYHREWAEAVARGGAAPAAPGQRVAPTCGWG